MNSCEKIINVMKNFNKTLAIMGGLPKIEIASGKTDKDKIPVPAVKC